VYWWVVVLFVQVISWRQVEWIFPFTGLKPRQFRKLVRCVERRGGAAIADGRSCWRWSLDLADRVLLIAVYYRTNLTMRQLALLFGVKHAAVHRIIDRLARFVDMADAKPLGPAQISIVDGTLMPVHDQAVSASSKDYRHSANLQILIHADKRLVLAVGTPLPGNRNDCTAYSQSGIDTAAGCSTVSWLTVDTWEPIV